MGSSSCSRARLVTTLKQLGSLAVLLAILLGAAGEATAKPLRLVAVRVHSGGRVLHDQLVEVTWNGRSRVRALTTGSPTSSYSDPAVSPRGHTVLASLRTQDRYGHATNGFFLVRFRFDGCRLTQPQRIGPGAWFAPAWSPSGARIAIATDRPNGYPEVLTADPEGQNASIASAPQGGSITPAWGRGGLFVVRSPFIDHGLDISAGDGPLERVTSLGDAQVLGGRNSSPAASPSSSAVAFVRSYGAVRSLTMITGAGKIRRLTHGKNDGPPSWSPDGRRLVFTRVVGRGYELATIDIRTGRVIGLGQATNGLLQPRFVP